MFHPILLTTCVTNSMEFSEDGLDMVVLLLGHHNRLTWTLWRPFFWGQVKTIIYETLGETPEAVITKIVTSAIENQEILGIFDHISQSFLCRCTICNNVRANGTFNIDADFFFFTFYICRRIFTISCVYVCVCVCLVCSCEHILMTMSVFRATCIRKLCNEIV